MFHGEQALKHIDIAEVSVGRKHKVSDETKAAIRLAFDRGDTVRSIAATFGVSVSTASRIALQLGAAPRLSEGRRAQISAAVKAENRQKRRDEAFVAVEVPAWAAKAGLGQTYRDVAEIKGEEAAASACRRLKRRAEGKAA